MRKLLSYFFILLVIAGGAKQSFAQQAKIDSLQKLLLTAKEDTNKLNALLQLGNIFQNSNPDTAIYFHTQATVLAGKLEAAFPSPSGERLGVRLKKAEAIRATGWDNYLKGDYQKALSLHNDALNIVESKVQDKKALIMKTDVLVNIGVVYYSQADYPKALDYYLKALKMKEELGDKNGIAIALGNIGLVYYYQADYPKALDYYFKALKMAEELGLKQLQANTLDNIGVVYYSQADYPKALDYYFKALKMKEELGDKNGIAIALGNIGVVYYYQADYPKALDYYFKALKMAEELGDKNGVARHLGNIGSVYASQADYPKALDYYFKALKMAEELGLKQLQANTLGNIGRVYYFQADYPKALDYYFKALKMAEKLGDKNEVARHLGNIGSLYIKIKKYKEAEEYLIKSLALSKEIGALSITRDVEVSYSELDSIRATSPLTPLQKRAEYWRSSLEHYKKYIAVRDSIDNDEKKKKQLYTEAKYEFEKKEAVMKEQQQAAAEVAAEESKRQKIIIVSVIIVLLIVTVFLLNVFRKNKIISRQKQEVEKKNLLIEEQKKRVEEKNKEITDSINYARRIQEAILPEHDAIRKLLPESFLIFLPKDILSGDFYWYTERDGKVIITAADCTGHGVPGAFMTIIGTTLLNEIVNKKGVTKPSEILQHLREGIIYAMKQTGEIGEQKDGMDIALISFEPGNGKLQYAGAFNSLFLVRNGELEEIKADRMPIGISEKPDMPFTNHEISLQMGDLIYIFSDGYRDQFGGDKGKKLMTKKFKQLFLDVYAFSMEEQKIRLIQYFEDWKGGREQCDDVLVIGVRV